MAKKKVIQTPSAAEDVTVRADYLELLALKARDRSVSLAEIAGDLKMTGTAEPLDPEEDGPTAEFLDRGDEDSGRAAEDTLGEIADRWAACNESIAVYPFQPVSSRRVVRDPNAVSTAYVFMLLLSKFGYRAGPPKSYPERLFEDLCTVAARNYLGGIAAGVRAQTFGFPRRTLPKHFPKALAALCAMIGEMTPNGDAPTAKDQKDAKLDIVAWRPFRDGRQSALIAFGQCATGGDDAKPNELQPLNWSKKWLLQHPYVPPVRLFFVPWRVPSSDLRNLSIDAGVVFDRCRVADLCPDAPPELLTRCAAWSSAVVAGKF